jgi:hypothetical protein
LDDPLDRVLKLKKMGMRFGTWHIRSLYGAGSHMTIANNIKMVFREIGWDSTSTDCIDLVEDRDQWRALVSMVINYGLHKILGNY